MSQPSCESRRKYAPKSPLSDLPRYHVKPRRRENSLPVRTIRLADLGTVPVPVIRCPRSPKVVGHAGTRIRCFGWKTSRGLGGIPFKDGGSGIEAGPASERDNAVGSERWWTEPEARPGERHTA